MIKFKTNLVRVEISNVDESELQDFVDIYHLAYKRLEEYAYTTTREIKSYFHWLLMQDRNGFFKAKVGERIVGFTACDARRISYVRDVKVKVGEIHEVIVHPNFRRLGIGRKLVEQSVEYFKHKGRKTCVLWVGVRNEKAKKFYRNLGFRETFQWGKWMRMFKEI